jgi:hypothetical protein
MLVPQPFAAVCCFPKATPSRLKPPVCRDGVASQAAAFGTAFLFARANATSTSTRHFDQFTGRSVPRDQRSLFFD